MCSKLIQLVPFLTFPYAVFVGLVQVSHHLRGKRFEGKRCSIDRHFSNRKLAK